VEGVVWQREGDGGGGVVAERDGDGRRARRQRVREDSDGKGRGGSGRGLGEGRVRRGEDRSEGGGACAAVEGKEPRDGRGGGRSVGDQQVRCRRGSAGGHEEQREVGV
jgi:hypothetical protein